MAAQKQIDTLLLRHTKDFIPQMVEFKLSTVLNGSAQANKPVFSDSPVVGETYVPRKLKEVLRQLKTTQGGSEIVLEESSSEAEVEVAQPIARKERKAPKQRDDTFVPMNVYDLLEQANSERKSGWDDNNQEL